MNYPKSTLVFVNIIILCAFEIFTRILAYYHIVPYAHYPTSNERTLSDLDSDFGVWREPNKSVRHRGACFNVSYNTNSFGIRDDESKLKNLDKEQVVVLGDSFAEGFGVEANKRLTEVAEMLGSKEMLNFGVSGNFSSTQEYLQYKKLASKFEHSAVALYFLPANDFHDNDPKNFESDRYRPYLRKLKDEYEIYYPVEFENRKTSGYITRSRIFRRKLYNNIYLLNALRQLGDIFESSALKDKISKSSAAQSQKSRREYTQEDFEKLTWGYEKIAKMANPKPLYIFIIPGEIDFIQGNNETFLDKLTLKMKEFSKQHKNIKVINLLPLFLQNIKNNELHYKEIFLPCDSHWSNLGHQIAGEILHRTLETS